MSVSVLLAAVCAALAVLLAVPSAAAVRGPGPPAVMPADGGPSRDLVSGWWWLWAISAGLGPVAVVGGSTGALLGAAAGIGVAVLTRRAEPAEARRARERMRRELPALVELLGAALAAGAPVGRALGAVTAALPGAASDELAGVQARLQVGLDPVRVWGRLSAHPSLAPLATVMARAHESGASVTAAVADLGDELAARERAEVEDRARTVGVRAAVPLGLCLLPSFLLLGIVPLVAAAVDGIDW